MKTLRFQDLKPERDEFELEDGTKVDFVSRTELDGLRLATFDAILRDVLRASTRVARKKNNEKAMAELGVSVDRAIRFLLPDLPDGATQALGVDQKLKILTWWHDRNSPGRAPAADGQGEASTG